LWFRVGIDRKRAYASADALIRDMWKSIPAGPGIVFWEDDMYLRLRAIQLLEHDHPELDVWHGAALDAPIARKKFAAAHGFDPLDGLTDELRASRLAS